MEQWEEKQEKRCVTKVLDEYRVLTYFTKELKVKITINTRACYGCRICELACSFHHQRLFSPELSSIRVLTCMRTGEISWSIDSTCDFCEGEEQPLCEKYCLYGSLKGVECN